jgi:hypothetical protein
MSARLPIMYQQRIVLVYGKIFDEKDKEKEMIIDQQNREIKTGQTKSNGKN